MSEKKKLSRSGGGPVKRTTTSAGGRVCPHCGYRMAAKDVPPGPVKLCPTCRMILPQGDIA